MVLGAAFAVLASACGSSAVTPDSTGEVAIELSEFQFAPDAIEVKVGQTVRFVVDNQGSEAHEFMVGRTVDDEAGFADGFETDFFDGVEVLVTGNPTMVMSGDAIIEGAHADESMTMDEGMAMDDGAAMDEGMAMDDGTAMDEGMAMDDGAAMDEGMAMDDGAAMDEGMAMDDGAAMDEGMAMDDGAAMDDAMAMAVEGDEHHGFMIMQDPLSGQTIIEFVVPNKLGEWTIACFEEEGAHYEDGMKGTLKVIEG